MRPAMYQGMSMKRYRPNKNAYDDHASLVDADVEEVTGARQTRNMANIERMSVESWTSNERLDEERKNEEIGARLDRRYRKRNDDDDETRFGANDRRTQQAERRSFRSNLNHPRTHLNGDADRDITSRDDDDKDGIQIIYVGDDARIIRSEG